MKANNRFRVILISVLILVMVLSYVANRAVRRSVQTSKSGSLFYSDQNKIDAYNRAKKEEAERTQKLIEKGEKQREEGKLLTIDGWDPATQSIIDPINLWANYETRTYAGKVRHGEKVTLIRREGDGVLIQTKSGVQGWVTYFFIKEFGK